MTRVRASGILTRGGTVLTLQYRYSQGLVYGFPGGGNHDGETLSQTVVREFQEELNLNVAVKGVVFVGNAPAQPTIPATLHVVFEVSSHEDPVLNPQHTSAAGFAWLDQWQLENLNLYPAIDPQALFSAAHYAPYSENCLNRDWL